MEQDVFAVVGKEGWSVAKSTPTTSTQPSKHILAELCSLHL